MTAPEVFQVRDGDGWEVYVTNPAGGWWLLGDVGGTAVVDTLPDGAEAMGRVCTQRPALYKTVVHAANRNADYGIPVNVYAVSKRDAVSRAVAIGWSGHSSDARVTVRSVEDTPTVAEGGDRRG